MPRKAKPDDRDWIDLSANQNRQVKAAMRRIAKTRHLEDRPIPDDDPPISPMVKVFNEIMDRQRRRKVN
jgi:hypothetical protein